MCFTLHHSPFVGENSLIRLQMKLSGSHFNHLIQMAANEVVDGYRWSCRWSSREVSFMSRELLWWLARSAPSLFMKSLAFWSTSSSLGLREFTPWSHELLVNETWAITFLVTLVGGAFHPTSFSSFLREFVEKVADKALKKSLQSSRLEGCRRECRRL